MWYVCKWESGWKQHLTATEAKHRCKVACKKRGGAASAASFSTCQPCLHGLWDSKPQPLPEALPPQQAPTPQMSPWWVLGANASGLPEHKGRAKTMAESKGLHNLGSKAKMSLCDYVSLRFTPPPLAL